jgi:hypothetical protein
MKVVSLSALRTDRLYPKEILLVLISIRCRVNTRARVPTEGIYQWNIPVAPLGIEPVTWFVVQCVNHCVLLTALCTLLKIIPEISGVYISKRYILICSDIAGEPPVSRPHHDIPGRCGWRSAESVGWIRSSTIRKLFPAHQPRLLPQTHGGCLSQTNQYAHLLSPGELLNVVQEPFGCELVPEPTRKVRRSYSSLCCSIRFQYRTVISRVYDDKQRSSFG